jgi:hypothetical protein
MLFELGLTKISYLILLVFNYVFLMFLEELDDSIPQKKNL